MIEVIEIDGNPVSIAGDYFETLIFIKANSNEVVKYLCEKIQADEINFLGNPDEQIIEVKAQKFLEKEILSELYLRFNIQIIEGIKSRASSSILQKYANPIYYLRADAPLQ